MVAFGTIASWLFSVFLVTSPLTSYLDTALTIKRRKSAAGFSVDVCGIMLVASLLRINFWLGEPYELALLIQSCVMICVHCYLLHVCLLFRAAPGPGYIDVEPSKRPWQLWQWADTRTYWRFLAQFLAGLVVLQIILGQSAFYVTLLGMTALTIEATLPIPQFLQNLRTRSVEGVRLTMIGSWVFGDFCKLCFFFMGSTNIAWQFKACAVVQAFFDASIAVQYYLWHDKPPSAGAHLGGSEYDFSQIRLGHDLDHDRDSLASQQRGGAATILPL